MNEDIEKATDRAINKFIIREMVWCFIVSSIAVYFGVSFGIRYPWNFQRFQPELLEPKPLTTIYPQPQP